MEPPRRYPTPICVKMDLVLGNPKPNTLNPKPVLGLGSFRDPEGLGWDRPDSPAEKRLGLLRCLRNLGFWMVQNVLGFRV